MTFLDVLSPADRSAVEALFRPVHFPKDARILHAGDPGNGCYLIDDGEVRLEMHHCETDSDNVLGYLDPGDFLGELSLVDGQPRSASAFAHTEVKARWFGRSDFEELCARQPSIGIAVHRALAENLAHKLRAMNDRLVEFLSADEIDEATNEIVARAVAAQRELAQWPEEKIDAMLLEIAKTIADHAEELAEATVKETGMGVAADKAVKNRVGSLEACRALVEKPGAGGGGQDEGRGLTEFPYPMGVVFGLNPLSNPVATFVFKTLICLKSRNAVILSCHRCALQSSGMAGELIREVLRRHGAPLDLLQWVRERASRCTTAMFMRHPDVSLILATGGPSVLRAAYSSGKPAIGVSAGHAPVWICGDADVNVAAEMIVKSKTFDNGLVWGAESNLVIDASVEEAFLKALEANGAVIIDGVDKKRFLAAAFDEEGLLRREFVGQSAEKIASQVGIEKRGRLLVVRAERRELESSLAREKLGPVVAAFVANGEAEGLNLCAMLLGREGIGHTAMVHTKDPEVSRRFASRMTASRVLINTPGMASIGIGNGLTSSMLRMCRAGTEPEA